MRLAVLILSIVSSPPAVIVRADDASELGGAEALGGPFYRVRHAQLRHLRSRPGVRWAYAEARRRILLDADPSEYLQWHLHNDGSLTDIWPHLLAGADIGARQAWEISEGSPDVVVAVLDGGIPAEHPDLPAPARLPGYDFVDRDDDPSPVGSGSLPSHGTAVAGLALAARNGQGVAGVCPGCRLLPVRVLAPDVTARDGDLIAALIFAAEQADVINASWSFDPHSYVSPAIYDAIRWAATEGRSGRGVVMVFSAGNRSSAIDPYAPEAMTETITVAATDERDERAVYSNSGPVTIAAPGGKTGDVEAAKIVTADLEGDAGNNPLRDQSEAPGVVDDLAVTASFTGTSASAPEVAGAAGLLLSIRPELTANEVAWILTETAAKVGAQGYDPAGRNPGLGYGRLNIGAAAAMARSGGYCVESPEVCDNNVDDDCDRLADGADEDCGAILVVPFEVEVGAPCTESSECGDGYCAQPDGRDQLRQCTADCDFDCPDRAACVGRAGSGRCLATCVRQVDCAVGARCEFPDAGLVPPGQQAQSVCLPRCDDDGDCRDAVCRDGVCAGDQRARSSVTPPPETGCDCAAGPGALGLILLLVLGRRLRPARTEQSRARRRRSLLP